MNDDANLCVRTQRQPSHSSTGSLYLPPVFMGTIRQEKSFIFCYTRPESFFHTPSSSGHPVNSTTPVDLSEAGMSPDLGCPYLY
ncbi:hypothetical protein E2C01_004810 [Portunus trituberculatus]|uniref:Uncharacterized protein n=1 Tax=Portunus trituberculatus TaxID=210409 RepID=A0A5B7CXF9_PORTR|nr:hypothetical protein [Portunus trituberculatus]